jgi:hypothetical protein
MDNVLELCPVIETRVAWGSWMRSVTSTTLLTSVSLEVRASRISRSWTF